MNKNNVLRLWQVVLAVTLMLCPLMMRAQDDGNTVGPMLSRLHGDGLYNPLAPDVAAIAKYGEAFDVDLFSGTVGLSIPIYKYEDERFSVPVSFSYSSSGYKPNIQTGVLGLGWYLNVGGAITREVRGIVDEEGVTSTDMYDFERRNEGRQDDDPDTPIVLGYGALFLDEDELYGNLYTDYFKDFVFYGKAGSEYFPVWNWNQSTNAYERDVIETQPDIFHFSFMGRKGSFILQPCGQVVVYDTEDSVNNYAVSVSLTPNGFEGFTIRTEDNYAYVFSQTEIAESWTQAVSTTNVTHCDTWRLSRIESPDGRRVLFLYDDPYSTRTYDPTWLYDYRYAQPMDGSESQGDGGEGDDDPMPFSQEDPTENIVYTSCLKEIRIEGRASILFTYSQKSYELNATYDGWMPKLDSVVVRSLISGQTIRQAVCSYSLSGCSRSDLYDASQPGVTFLHTVSLSGEGAYTMDYYDRSATFPPIDTYSVDWFGYYNPSVTKNTFMPTVATAESGTGYLFTMRQPSLTGTMKGMLSSVQYPTGGHSTFEYEQNTYSSDQTGHNHSGNSYPTGGVRIKRISSYDTDSTLAVKREFQYLLPDGKSSGNLYWLPMLFSKYVMVSYGFKSIQRTTLSSGDNFPYSKGTHIGYTRVVECQPVDSGGISKSLSLYEFQSQDTSCGRDQISYSNSYSGGYSPFLAIWSCSMNSSYNYADIQRVQANIRSRKLGKLLSCTICSDTLSCPAQKTVYVYSQYNPFDSIPFTTYDTILGYDVVQTWNFETFYHQNDVRKEYANDGTMIRYESVQTALDNNYRPGIRTYSGTESDDTVEEIAYFSDMPSLVSERLVTRGGRYIGGEHWDYQSNNTHPTFYFPREVSYANTLSSVNSDPLFEEELEWEITSETGLPLQVRDRSGKRTCYVWEYGGACLAMKVEGATLSQAGIQGVYSGVLPASADAAARAVSGARVTTWTNLHLVGITSEKDPSGRITRYTYDSAGRITGVSQEDADGLDQVDLKHYDYNIKNDNE